MNPRYEADLVTSFINPPIPIRRYDWCAYRDGYEERGGYGYGRTENEAVADLLAIEESEKIDAAMDSAAHAEKARGL